MEVRQTILERMENNMSKWYGQVVRMDDNRWPKRITKWRPEGRRRRGRPEVRWGKEVERVMKHRNLTPDEAINRQLWRLETSNRWTTGKLIIFSYKTRLVVRCTQNPL
jgi:hypothetical protein